MKKLVSLLLVLLLLPLTALAGEVKRITGEHELPQGWREKELMRVTVLDMQRSDSILVQCGGENMLVDGGFANHHKRLFKALDERGVTSFKYLWNTHCDGDHSGGLQWIAGSGKYGTGEVLCTNPYDYNDPDGDHQLMANAALNNGWAYSQLFHGDVFTLGSATILTLKNHSSWGQNNASAACIIRFGGSSIFLTGDIGTRVQELFVQTVPADVLDCDILKAPHHGIDGVYAPFVSAVSPEAVVITNTAVGDHPPAPEWRHYSPYCSGDGIVVLETDGETWYVWQLPNWVDDPIM